MEYLGSYLGVGYMGLMFSIAMFIGLSNKVRRLERILRENGITAKGTAGLGDQLRRQVGQTVMLTLDYSDGDLTGKKCRVLDTDETWALVLANEGKKKECEKLIRLDSVTQIKVK